MSNIPEAIQEQWALSILLLARMRKSALSNSILAAPLCLRRGDATNSIWYGELNSQFGEFQTPAQSKLQYQPVERLAAPDSLELTVELLPLVFGIAFIVFIRILARSRNASRLDLPQVPHSMITVRPKMRSC